MQNFKLAMLLQVASSLSLLLLLPAEQSLASQPSSTWNLRLVADKHLPAAARDLPAKLLAGVDSDGDDATVGLLKIDTSLLAAEPQAPESSLAINSRRGRKLNLLGGFNFKPRASPLYLLNGTLCRFVNAMPICTTLTTTGIMTSPSSQGGANAAQQPRPGNLVQGQQSSVQFAGQRSSGVLPFVSALMAGGQERASVRLEPTLAKAQPQTAPLFHSALAGHNVTLPLLNGLLMKKMLKFNKRQQQTWPSGGGGGANATTPSLGPNGQMQRPDASNGQNQQQNSQQNSQQNNQNNRQPTRN